MLPNSTSTADHPNASPKSNSSPSRFHCLATPVAHQGRHRRAGNATPASSGSDGGSRAGRRRGKWRAKRQGPTRPARPGSGPQEARLGGRHRGGAPRGGRGGRARHARKKRGARGRRGAGGWKKNPSAREPPSPPELSHPPFVSEASLCAAFFSPAGAASGSPPPAGACPCHGGAPGV